MKPSYTSIYGLNSSATWFSFDWFYGISTIVGYLMTSPAFTYILDIWFVNTQLNEQTVLFLTIQFSISQKIKWFQALLCITSYSIKHPSLVYTQLNDQAVLFLTILFCRSHSFALSLNVKHFYLTNRLDPFRCYQSGPEWTWELCQWRGTSHSPKLLHYWSLTIRLFNVISWTLVGGILALCRDTSTVFYSPSRLGWRITEEKCHGRKQWVKMGVDLNCS